MGIDRKEGEWKDRYFTRSEVAAKEADPMWERTFGGSYEYLGDTEAEDAPPLNELMRWGKRQFPTKDEHRVVAEMAAKEIKRRQDKALKKQVRDKKESTNRDDYANATEWNVSDASSDAEENHAELKKDIDRVLKKTPAGRKAKTDDETTADNSRTKSSVRFSASSSSTFRNADEKSTATTPGFNTHPATVSTAGSSLTGATPVSALRSSVGKCPQDAMPAKFDPNDMEDAIHGVSPDHAQHVYIGMGVAPIKGESASNRLMWGFGRLLTCFVVVTTSSG